MMHYGDEGYEAMSPEDRQEWLLAQIAGDLQTVRKIVVAWWWLVWIGVAITVVAALTASAQV